MELTPEQKKFARDMAIAWVGSEQMYEDLPYDAESELGMDWYEEEELAKAIDDEITRLHMLAVDAIKREDFRP